MTNKYIKKFLLNRKQNAFHLYLRPTIFTLSCNLYITYTRIRSIHMDPLIDEWKRKYPQLVNDHNRLDDRCRESRILAELSKNNVDDDIHKLGSCSAKMADLVIGEDSNYSRQLKQRVLLAKERYETIADQNQDDAARLVAPKTDGEFNPYNVITRGGFHVFKVNELDADMDYAREVHRVILGRRAFTGIFWDNKAKADKLLNEAEKAYAKGIQSLNEHDQLAANYCTDLRQKYLFESSWYHPFATDWDLIDNYSEMPSYTEPED
jgi:hypothetical protein